MKFLVMLFLPVMLLLVPPLLFLQQNGSQHVVTRLLFGRLMVVMPMRIDRDLVPVIVLF